MGRSIEIGSDNIIELIGLMDANTGDYLNDATVAGVLKKYADNTLIVNITFSYVADTNGNYVGTIPAATTAELEDCKTYTLEVSASADSSLRLWKEQVRAFYGGIL